MNDGLAGDVFWTRFESGSYYPFRERDDHAIIAYGHVDKTLLARQINEFDVRVGLGVPGWGNGQLEPTDLDYGYAAWLGDPADRQIKWRGVGHEDPGAFPITVATPGPLG